MKPVIFSLSESSFACSPLHCQLCLRGRLAPSVTRQLPPGLRNLNAALADFGLNHADWQNMVQIWDF